MQSITIWLSIALGILFFLEIFDYFVLYRKQGWFRSLCFLFVVCVMLPYPLLVPENLGWIRFFFSMVVFNKILKSLEITYNHVNPEHLKSFGRYLFWSLNFPEPTWPATEDQAFQSKIQGKKRIFRSLIKLALLSGLFVFSTIFSFVDTLFYVRMLWLMLVAYLLFSALIDMITGITMQSGIFLEEVFDSPLLAKSPREFWGKRWNLYFRNVCHRNVFEPLGGTKRPVLAVVCVFGVSSLLHEYMIFVSAGKSCLGYMTLFFSCHCLATIAQTLLTKKIGKKKIFPAPIAIALHLSWMILVIPIFMEPILLLFPAHTWKLW